MTVSRRKPRSRVSAGWSFLIAAAFAGGQAVLPPVGDLFGSVFVHLSLLLLFLGCLVPWRSSRAAVASLAAYGLVLGVALALPFELLDSEVELGSREVALNDIPRLLEANDLRVRFYPEELPAIPISLPTSSPSLASLASALRSELGMELRKMPVCGNSISISFLWGARSPTSLLLTPADRASWERLQEYEPRPPSRALRTDRPAADERRAHVVLATDTD